MGAPGTLWGRQEIESTCCIPAVTPALALPPSFCLVFSGGDGDVTGANCQLHAECQAKQPEQVCASSVPGKEGHQKK